MKHVKLLYIVTLLEQLFLYLYYQGKKFECIDIIEDYDLGFCLGNALKYILRAGKKDDRDEDIRKAIWYLQREIASV